MGPWLPFSDHNNGDYERLKNCYSEIVGPDLRGKELDKAAESTLKMIILTSERIKSDLPPSGYWGKDIGEAAGSWKDWYGFLLDDVFVSLARTSPSILLYTRLLAARDVLFGIWISYPRGHTSKTTLIILALSNMLAILDIRFLSLRGGRHKKWGLRLAKSIPPTWNEILTRPEAPLHENRFNDTLAFMSFQVNPISGLVPEGTHLVYLMTVGGAPYVGRTNGIRRSATKTIPGILARWSEYVRELHKHAQGNLPASRQRRRYNELLKKHCTNCFNCLILESSHSSRINAIEAKHITMINPGANGNELKYFAENLRLEKSKRKPTAEPRQRRSRSVRKRTRDAHLKAKDAQWGADINEHGKERRVAVSKNLEKQYENYAGKKLRERDFKNALALKYHELYLLTLAATGMCGCLNIYSPGNLLLFISACTYHITVKKLSVEWLLQSHGKNSDYCYFLIGMCNFIPSYAPKQRAIGLFRSYLTRAHLPYSIRYVIRLHADMGRSRLWRWTNDRLFRSWPVQTALVRTRQIENQYC